jgi:hypothetical protein
VSTSGGDIGNLISNARWHLDFGRGRTIDERSVTQIAVVVSPPAKQSPSSGLNAARVFPSNREFVKTATAHDSHR